MRCFTKFLIILSAAALFLNAAERFDYLVRADFFSGMAGDQKAMDRAMKLCEDTLAKNPKHPEALVWHGSGLIVGAGQAFRAGNPEQGSQLWSRGLLEMADAVAIAPENPAVLIPRGATLFTMAQFSPDPASSRELTRGGVADYQKVYDIQKLYFDKLSGHSRGELLYGLAAGYSRLGDQEHARPIFETLAAVGPSSGHEPEAKEYLASGKFSAHPAQCAGCHTK